MGLHEKSRVLIHGPAFYVLQKSAKDPCAMCIPGVSKNFVFGDSCISWVHKKCSGISGIFKPEEWTMYCTGQTCRWPTNDRCHSGKEGVCSAAILLLTWGLFILMWWLWTQFHHKMPCHMGQIQCVPAHSHLQLIPHHLQRKSLQLMHQ